MIVIDYLSALSKHGSGQKLDGLSRNCSRWSLGGSKN